MRERGWLWAIATLLWVLQNVDCLASKTKTAPRLLLGHSKDGFRKTPIHHENVSSTEADEPEPEALWFNQRIDHFSPNEDRTFKQRYFYNAKFYKEGGPAILLLGAEDAEDGSMAYGETYPHMEWAKNLSAAIFNLEHRFYGESRPFEQQTTENLAYLSSRQAIEDIAGFIKAMNKEHNYTTPKWVVYGGSYAGALALWFREKYPDLTVGAVGSSAPLQITFDFHGYSEGVEEALALWPDCYSAVSDGLQQIHSLMWTSAGRDKLSTQFNLEPRFNETELRHKDIQYFFMNAVGGIMLAVQDNPVNLESNETEYSIPNICAIMTNQTIGTAVQRLAAVYFYGEDEDYMDNDYNAFVAELQVATYNDSDLETAATRSWTWQQCTEFGYFQTTDYGKGIFGSAIPLNLYIDWCKDTFGEKLTVENIQKNVHDTSLFYGNKESYNGTNAVLLYGSIDPWHKLGLYSSTSPSVIIFLIDGAAHCADMYPPSPNDPPGLVTARQIAFDNVRKWVTSAAPSNVASIKFGDQEELPDYDELKPFEPTITTIPPAYGKKKVHKSEKQKRYSGGPFMVLGRPYHGLLPDPPDFQRLPGAEPRDMMTGFITQPADQFDINNLDTFQQQYWINMKYYKPGGPQFLFLGGESAANEKWVTTNVTFMEAARRYNAMAFMLEHRFYGQSRLESNMSSAMFHYLTTRQALGDVARFIKFMNKERNFINPRWVTFGGSYSGSLSAWFRQKYTNLTIGAIASSAAPEIKVDFFEYLIVTERSLRHYSQLCGDNIKTAFTNMHQMSLTAEGRINLTSIFKLDPGWTSESTVTDTDIQFFFQDVYDKFQGAVQYNNDNREGSVNGGGIKEVCEIMKNTSEGDEVQRVAAVYKYIINFHGGNFTALNNSYQNYVNFLRTDDYSNEEATDARGWMYACCTEIGYLQSTDIGDNAFGSVAPVNFWLNLCEDVFGKEYVPAGKIYDTVGAAQKYYRGRDGYTATNVVFVSGKIDPWHALGLSKDRETDTMKVLMLEETAHCADMYPARPEDPQELVDARQQIFDNIGRWIEKSTPNTTTSQPTTSTSSTSTLTETMTSTTSTATTSTTTTTTSQASTTTFSSISSKVLTTTVPSEITTNTATTTVTSVSTTSTSSTIVTSGTSANTATTTVNSAPTANTASTKATSEASASATAPTVSKSSIFTTNATVTTSTQAQTTSTAKPRTEGSLAIFMLLLACLSVLF